MPARRFFLHSIESVCQIGSEVGGKTLEPIQRERPVGEMTAEREPVEGFQQVLRASGAIERGYDRINIRVGSGATQYISDFRQQSPRLALACLADHLEIRKVAFGRQLMEGNSPYGRRRVCGEFLSGFSREGSSQNQLLQCKLPNLHGRTPRTLEEDFLTHLGDARGQ